MTAPREILAGRTYLITRRCTQRQFLIRPSAITNQVARYCLALAAARTGVLIHAVCFMSNHWHGVVTDPNARLPEFLEQFHRLFARAQNAALGRWENLWSSEKPSAVLLVDDRDVLDKIAYTIANPTAAGLVAAPTDWPGLITRHFEERETVPMPPVFFDPNGDLPKKIVLQLTRPPIFRLLSLAALERRLVIAVGERVRKARQMMASKRQEFVGAAGVVEQSPNARPLSIERRRTMSPRLAAHDTSARMLAIHRLAAFRRAYRIARQAWKAGVTGVRFPAGTYALRVHANVTCDSSPTC